MQGNGGSRVGEVRAGTTSPIPEHKGFMLQQLSEIHPITPAVYGLISIAIATTEALSDFLKIMAISPQKEPAGVILVSFDHFAASEFNIWLQS